MPRLTLDEWRDLGRAALKLTQVAGALRQTNWGGSTLAQAAVAECYETIAGIYNRCEKIALAHRSMKGEQSLFPTPEPAGQGDPSSEG